jgi:hypothetical protein
MAYGFYKAGDSNRLEQEKLSANSGDTLVWMPEAQAKERGQPKLPF